MFSYSVVLVQFPSDFVRPSHPYNTLLPKCESISKALKCFTATCEEYKDNTLKGHVLLLKHNSEAEKKGLKNTITFSQFNF